MRQVSLILPSTLAALALAACTGKSSDNSHIFDSDTAGVCGRVRGSSGGILRYEGGGDDLHAPTETPSTEVKTTGVTGPVAGASGMIAVQGGQVLSSVDTGCNWTETGNLPATGDWALAAAGDRVYAFDRLSSDGAYSDNLGDSWAPFDTAEPFVDPPVVDLGSGRIRGVQARGVVTSDDAGASWALAGDPPFPPRGGSVSASNLDIVVIAGDGGVQFSHTGGSTWDDVSTTLVGIEDGPVAGVRVGVSPVDDDVLFAITDGTDGTRTIQHSVDGGLAWNRLGDSTQITIGDDARVYSAPTDPTQMLSSSFVPDSNKLNLYRITVGEGIHAVGVGGYTTMQQIAMMDDVWLAGVSAVP